MNWKMEIEWLKWLVKGCFVDLFNRPLYRAFCLDMFNPHEMEFQSPPCALSRYYRYIKWAWRGRYNSYDIRDYSPIYDRYDNEGY